MIYEDLPTYSRYEVRTVNKEELYMMGYEEAMHYTPCKSLREAIKVYKEYLEGADSLHTVSLCGVTYGAGGYESVTTLASSENLDPLSISFPIGEDD